jgi:hypothetical protein
LILQSDEEQDRETLHGNCLVPLDGFGEMSNAFFDPDPQKHQAAREEVEQYVDRNCEYSPCIEVIHEEFQ